MIQKFLPFALFMALFIVFTPSALAGDCTKRDTVDWHATIKSAVNIRTDCPEGDVVGVVPAGEVVTIIEVDKHRDFYMVQTSVGTGFVYNSFLENVNEFPRANDIIELASATSSFSNSVFSDLNPNHPYYQHIKDVKERGIVNGSNGKIFADNPINRAELAKILVEATTDDAEIAKASLSTGVYSDIQAGAWYTKYLEIARRRRIMTGDKKSIGGITTVRPADSANGGEVAKMIAVAFGLPVRTPTSNEAWFDPYLDALDERDALPYTSATHQVTRGEMMFMISEILNSGEIDLTSDANAQENNQDTLEENIAHAAEPRYIDFTQSEYDALLGSQPFVLFFHADWCPKCRKLEDEIKPNIADFPPGSQFLKVNYDTATALKQTYSVTLQSSFVVIDANGNIVDTFQYISDIDQVKAAIIDSL